MFAGFLTPERERHIEQLIRRRGAAVLFTARFLVGVRGPVYLTAGILHFPYRRFLLIDLVCATIVVSLFYSLAWFYGPEIISWIRTAEEGITVAVILAVIVGAVFLWLHHRRSQRLIETLDRISEGLPASEAMADVNDRTLPGDIQCDGSATATGHSPGNGNGNGEQTSAPVRTTERD